MPKVGDMIVYLQGADVFRAGRDAFNKREKANEDYYVKQKEKEKYECPYPINPVYQDSI